MTYTQTSTDQDYFNSDYTLSLEVEYTIVEPNK